MSYEPTLVIKKSDLDTYEDFLYSDWQWPNDTETTRVLQFLKGLYNESSIAIIDDIQLIICQPEFSTFNARVREHLKEWDVQFSIVS